MQPTHSSRTAAVLGLAALVILPSCSLPPSESWRQIRQDGLIPFIANGMSAPKATDLGQPSGPLLASQNASAPKIVEPAQPKVQPVAAPTEFPAAYSVSGLTGYVRSPHTNPPRLIDVRGMSVGSKVVCPYTQRPFIVPAAAVSPAVTPKTQLAANQPKPAATKPAPAPQSRPQTPAAPELKAGPQLAATAPAPQPKPQAAPTPAAPPAPAKTEQSKPKPGPAVAANTPPAKTTPAPAPSSPPATAKVEPKKEPAPAPQAAATKMPFGAPIPGRPGFVNSPYAEKHQLVDVTGLSVGTEVKCPYTGKLFRVPPQAQAKK